MRQIPFVLGAGSDEWVVMSAAAITNPTTTTAARPTPWVPLFSVTPVTNPTDDSYMCVMTGGTKERNKATRDQPVSQ